MSSRLHRALLLGAPCLLLAALPSCLASGGPGGGGARLHWTTVPGSSLPLAGGPTQDGEAAKDGDAAEEKQEKQEKPLSPEAKAEKRAEELLEKRRELGHAGLELRIAQAKAAEAGAAAGVELDKAQRALSEAELDLATFQELERPQKLAQGELEIERHAFRAEQRAQDLAQLVEDYEGYGDDPYAKRTGQIVVWRTERDLELMQRGLEQQRAAHALVRDKQMPRKERDLTLALDQARAALHQAQAKVERTELESQLALQKAEAKIDDLGRAIAKLEKAEREAAAGQEGAGEDGTSGEGRAEAGGSAEESAGER